MFQLDIILKHDTSINLAVDLLRPTIKRFFWSLSTQNFQAGLVGRILFLLPESLSKEKKQHYFRAKF